MPSPPDAFSHTSRRSRLRSPGTSALVVAAALICGSIGGHALESTLPADEPGWMGLYIRDLDRRDIAALQLPQDQRGVVVSGVDDDGPAATVGLEPGDVITRLDGRRVDTRADFVRILGNRRPGDRVRLDLTRRNVARQAEFTLRQRPHEMQGPVAGTPGQVTPRLQAAPEAAAASVWLVPLGDRDLASYFGVAAGAGLLVLQVASTERRLRAGDVILACNDTDVTSLDELEEARRRASLEDDLQLRVARHQRTRTIRLRREDGIPAFVSVPATVTGTSAPVDSDHWRQVQEELEWLQQRLRALEAEVEKQARR